MIKRRRLPAPAIVLFLFFAAAVTAAAQPRSDEPGAGMRLGFRVDYFSQTVNWDNPGEASTSDLTSALAAAELRFALGRSSSISVFAGYGTTDIGNLMFRSLPFSIDYQAGAGGGVALGGAFDFAVTAGPAIRVSFQGEITAFLGSSIKREVPGLAVDGTLEAKPTWFRARVGPVLAFGAETRVQPYIFPFFHYLWGNFALSESIESLSGEEKNNLEGESLFGVAGGLDIPLSPSLKLRAEAGVYPGKGGAGYSATLATMFSF